jgi:hypothetical protein
MPDTYLDENKRLLVSLSVHDLSEANLPGTPLGRWDLLDATLLILWFFGSPLVSLLWFPVPL